MDLPRIPATEPVVIPATVEKTYPDWYLVQLLLRPISPEMDQRLTVQMRRYNYDTKELSPNEPDQVYLNVNDVFAEAGRSTLFAQAMGLVITVAGLLQQEQDLLAKLAVEQGPTALAALESQLAQVQTALGVTPQE